MSAAPTVRSAIDLRLQVSDGPALRMRSHVEYSPDDPYAVRVAFHTGTNDVVEWTFARSLLTDGVTHPVGEGDVQVWPSDSAGAPTVCLSVSSPSGCALFEAPLKELVQFLTRTYASVPTGSESDFVDLDSELSELFSN
jgi:hypothetical protein